MKSPDNPDIPDIRSTFHSSYPSLIMDIFVELFNIAIAFKVLAPNISKAQERYAELKRKSPQNAL